MLPKVNEATEVTTLTKCDTANAAYLHIMNISESLRNDGQYDVGGTYTSGDKEKKDLWFHFTTSKCLNGSYLLNLFVIIRKPGHYKISISKKIKGKENSGLLDNEPDILDVHFTDDLESFIFNFSLPDDNRFIKTYCFTAIDYATFAHKSIYIPIKIVKFNDTVLDHNILRGIREDHSYDTLYENRSAGDCTLMSSAGKSYKIHNVFLKHNAILEECLSKSQNNILQLGIDDEQTEILIKYLYTANVDTDMNRDYTSTLAVAHKFQIQGLLSLVAHILSSRINITNVIDTLILADNYGLDSLKGDVINYIDNNSHVLETDSWKKLGDLNLVNEVTQSLKIRKVSGDFCS